MFSIIVNISTRKMQLKSDRYVFFPFVQILFLLFRHGSTQYMQPIVFLASHVIKINSDSASKECKEFLVQ